MLVAVDIGNSNVVIGVYKENQWHHIWRVETIPGESAIYYEMAIRNFLTREAVRIDRINCVVLSSVVPALTDKFQDLLVRLFPIEPILVGPQTYPQLSLNIDSPNEIGSDLVANAVAALELYKEDCIIVDFGTALTFTTLQKSGRIQGVAIAPGIETAVKALSLHAAKLPEIPLELPGSAIGKNTIHAIQSGILIGYMGLTRGVMDAIKAEAGPHYKTIATGGLSRILTPLEADFDFIRTDLTLTGLRIIGESVSTI